MPVLSKPVRKADIGDSDNESVDEGRTRRLALGGQGQKKRGRADSSPLSERNRVFPRKKTPFEASSPAPADSEDASQLGAGDDDDSTVAESVAQQDKTKAKRMKLAPEIELIESIARIKTSKSPAYEGFKEPIINCQHNLPTHHLFKCKSCGKLVPRRVGVSETSNLINHLNRCKDKAKQSSLLDDYGLTGGSVCLTERDVREFCALWGCENARPFQIVKDRYLNKLLDPQARKHLPHCDTLVNDVERMYTATQQDITEQLSQFHPRQELLGTFHLALDMFQADNGSDHMGIVSFHQHIVEGETIAVKRFLLECLAVGGESHTGAALARAVYEVVCKFKIEHCVWGVVCNNASNNSTMMTKLADYGLKRLSGHESRIMCLLHVLNLVAKVIMSDYRKLRPKPTEADDDEDEYDLLLDFFPVLMDAANAIANDDDDEDLADNAPSWTLCNDEDGVFAEIELPQVEDNSVEAAELAIISRVLWKLAKFAHKIRYSPVARQVFREVCELLGLDGPFWVPRDSKSRWNSTGDMIKHGLRLFAAILKTQQEPRLAIPQTHCLHKDEQKYLEGLMKLLEPLKVLTEILSRSGISMLADDKKLPAFVQQGAKRALLVLNKYYGLTDKSHFYRLAILLHPSMRIHYLTQAGWQEEWIEEAISICVNTYTRFYKPASTSDSQTKARVSQFGYSSYMTRLYANVPGASSTTAKCPVHEFINASPILDFDAKGEPLLRNPLAWWHSQHVAGNEWNGLTQMALDVLSMPATSVDVERAFSFAGTIIGKRRHSLSLYSIQATASLGSYSKAGLVKRGCLVLPQEEKANTKEKAAKEKGEVKGKAKSKTKDKAKDKAKEKGKAKAAATEEEEIEDDDD